MSQHLIEGHVIRVDFDRIRGFRQRRNITRLIPGIASILAIEHIGKRDFDTLADQLSIASSRSFFSGRRQKDLALGLWEYDGALVPAFGDQIVGLRSDSSLLFDKQRPDVLISGSESNVVSDLR